MRTIKIGRSPDNDIVIIDESKTVSGHHALLKVSDNGNLFIYDTSTNGTYINGVKVAKNVDVSVKKGVEIRLGPHVIFDWSLASIPSSDINATEIDTDEKECYTIGTESDNRIVISDSTNHVSRHHAILKLKANGTFYIYDQSTNGTYVNGVKIKSKVDYPVSTSDTISLSNNFILEWNKVPNVALPKSSPYIPKAPSNASAVSVDVTKESGSKIWNYVLYTAIFIGVAYFSYIYYQSKNHNGRTDNTAEKVMSQSNPIQQQSLSSSDNAIKDISTLYEQNKDAVFVIYTSDGTNGAQGSGFFISSRGIAVSNYHVFKGSTKGLEIIKTTLGEYKVESVLTSSEDNDYIVFKVASLSTFPCLKIAKSLPKVGEDAFAIGAPEGLEHTLSKGIVSAYRGTGQSLIQTTTEITHGSSGGPLFNMNGEVIGITTAGLGDANLNFAVSIVGLGFERY